MLVGYLFLSYSSRTGRAYLLPRRGRGTANDWRATTFPKTFGQNYSTPPPQQRDSRTITNGIQTSYKQIDGIPFVIKSWQQHLLQHCQFRHNCRRNWTNVKLFVMPMYIVRIEPKRSRYARVKMYPREWYCLQGFYHSIHVGALFGRKWSESKTIGNRIFLFLTQLLFLSVSLLDSETKGETRIETKASTQTRPHQIEWSGGKYTTYRVGNSYVLNNWWITRNCLLQSTMRDDLSAGRNHLFDIQRDSNSIRCFL